MKNSDEVIRPLSELNNMINVGDIGMLSTLSSDGKIHSRPMETCFIDGESALYFFTTMDSHLSEELRGSGRVNLVFVRDKKHEYISITGGIEMINSSDTIATYWTDDFNRWIPEGIANPELVLLKVLPYSADYWGENSQLKRITRSVLDGDHVPEKVHKVMVG